KKAPHHAGASASFQPRVEWVIDLTKSEDDLLKDMHQKARYNIKLAQKKGVEIEIAKDNFKKYFESFYSLLGETAKRGGFSLHPKSYYEKMLDICEKDKNAFFVIARYGGKDLIINFVIHYGNMATYVFGGSNEEYRNLMPAYLVQWNSILESKRVGCKLYSFGNVNTEKYANTEWEGFSVFKKKFGGKTYEHSEFYDLVNQPFWYWMYNFRKRMS
ncbi:MAG: peptidoglycan bridge formation glycyltransferase FemA/FemB family protein, partial [bacterium]